jgi:MFS family permease
MSHSSSTSPVMRGLPAAGLTIAAGCLISMIGFGPRSSMGFFLTPISTEYGWGRGTFSLAFALQNLLWGIGQPFAGALADRFGTMRVLMGGLLLYALGLLAMTVTRDPVSFVVTSGILVGFGLSGCAFTLILGAFGKLLPPERRPMAFGLATASGSFGQFLFSPIAVELISSVGWQSTLYVFAALLVLSIPLAFLLWTAPAVTGQATSSQTDEGPLSISGALREAFAHPSYVMLVLGFFTCGFHLAFITGHLPAYLADKGLSTVSLFGKDIGVGGLALAAIGLFNIIGSLASGVLMQKMPRRWLLSLIYLARAIVIGLFITMPITPLTTLLFSASMGLLWLSTVPPTSGLVALMFGTRYMTMLFGFAFFSHQIGGFLGAWLGGVLYETYRSYDLLWWAGVAMGVASAVINMPIKERPVERSVST